MDRPPPLPAALPAPAPDTLAQRLYRVAWPLLSGALLLAGLVWLVASIMATRVEVRQAVADAQRITELRGAIVHLDEVLTMSARMAAATGSEQWIIRYEEAEPRLDAAIQDLIARASPDAAERLAATTDAANRRLVEIEREAFGLVQHGAIAAAAALFDGEEYGALKQAYAAGMTEFSTRLGEKALQRAASLERRAALERLALAVVLVAGVALGLRWHVRLRRALRRTQDVARTDALTGLANRRGLFERLGAGLAAAAGPAAQPPQASPIAVLLLDLDGFKAVNDRHGHAAGDLLLRLVAGRLAGCTRPGDITARLGGDEFAIVMMEVAADEVDAPARRRLAATSLATRLVAAIGEPFELGMGTGLVRIGASVGVALIPQHGEGAEALLHAADLALYRAKQEGRGRHVVFEPGMEEESRARAELDADLRTAIETGALVPHFQPLVSLTDGAIVGREMLARWNHPSRGPISPAEFIPAAERLGLIAPLTDLLMRRGCAAAALWPDDTTLAVNISPLLLRDPAWLLGLIDESLAASGLPPARLELELTETALVGDLATARETFAAVRARGVKVALDDFGTGHSGLRLLSELPVDRLKIDASFVQRMHQDAPSARIVASVIALAQGLGLEVVGEGIERCEDAEKLRHLGCDFGQGWLFGRPVPQPAATPAPAQAAA